jgi:RNA polymerase sigma factor (sigma-70 family)
MTNDETQRIRVLIADDHPVVRQGLRGMLAADDVEVVGEASTGKEAVELVERLAPEVVLMDIRMPDMDGLAAMAEMKKMNTDAHVIVLTTYYNVRYLVRAVIYGASAYFLKGIAREELLSAIRAVHAGESLLKIDQLRAIVDRVLKEDSKLAPAAVKKMRSLTRREREILGLVVQGLTNKQIAELLGISQATVKTHVENIIEKLGVSDRTQAAVWAVRAGVAGP